jgi:hypothetical protein
MIRYMVTEQDLRDAIEAAKPGWLDRAKSRTEQFVVAGRYDESSGIWSEIKQIYIQAACRGWIADPDRMEGLTLAARDYLESLG